MASESLTPPPSGGGYAKYLLVLLLLVGGGLGAYFATRKEPEPPKPAPPPTPNVERSTSLSQDTVEIPVDEPEVPDAGQAVVEPVKKPRAPAIDIWNCQGSLSGSDVRAVVADGSNAIRSCYERQLRNDNQLQGSVVLQVRIGNDGKVTATRVAGNFKDAEVKNCIQNVAKGWSFPAPAGGSCAVFDAPFKFTPKQ